MELKEPVKPNAQRDRVRFDGTAPTLSTNGTPVYKGTTKEPREDSPIALSGGDTLRS